MNTTAQIVGDKMPVLVSLAGNGDENVPESSVLFIRRATDFEFEEQPETRTIITINGAKLYCVDNLESILGSFLSFIKIIQLTLPNGSEVYVSAAAVKDVDDAPSTTPKGSRSWLVFGAGPRAARLAVRETRDSLREKWEDLDLDPGGSGI